MKKIITITILAFYSLNIFAQSDSVSLENVIISVNRLYQDKSKTGQQVAVLNKRDIQFLNPQTAAHALEQTGQVLVQRSQGGGGSPILRGFEANKVLLVVDGIRMNNAIYRGGHLQNVITIDPNMLERTEVLFGSQSLMYGSDALGGVMYFQTRKPEFSSDNNLRVNTGAMIRYSTVNQEKTANLTLNLGIKRIASLTSFSYSDFGNLHSGSNYNRDYPSWGKRNFYVERINNKDSIVKNNDPTLQVGTAYKQYDLIEKILFQQNQYITHTLNFQLSNSSDIPRFDRLSELNAKGLPTQAEWYYGPQKRTMLSYHFNHNKHTSFSDKIQIVAAFQDIEESRNTRGFGSSKKTQRIENVTVISLNADLQKTVGKQQFNYGLEVQNNTVDSKATFVNVNTGEIGAVSTRYPDGGSTMTSMAAYLSTTRKINDELDIFGGLRYNQTRLKSLFNDKTFFPLPYNELNQNHDALVGNIGVTAHDEDGFIVAPSFSTAYRAPNVDDVTKVFESIAGRLIVPNEQLKAEKTATFEVNFTKAFGESNKIQFIPFYTFYSNALTVAPSKFEGKDTILYLNKKSAVYSTQNIDKASVYGFYANLQAKIITNLSFSASYTYTKGNVLKNGIGTPLDHIPPMFGRISLDYKADKLQGSIYALFNGAKKSRDYRIGTEDNEIYSADPINGYMPAWATLNLRGSYTIKPYLTLQVGLENIFDTHYRIFASGVSGAGRNLSVTLRGGF